MILRTTTKNRPQSSHDALPPPRATADIDDTHQTAEGVSPSERLPAKGEISQNACLHFRSFQRGTEQVDPFCGFGYVVHRTARPSSRR